MTIPSSFCLVVSATVLVTLKPALFSWRTIELRNMCWAAARPRSDPSPKPCLVRTNCRAGMP